MPTATAQKFKINEGAILLTIHAPADFQKQLQPTNRKEYVEWIVNAKREETRTQRIKDTIERLGKEWKNPANLLNFRQHILYYATINQ